MLHSLKRKLTKRKSFFKRADLDIDYALKRLATKSELNSIFDENKVIESHRLGCYTMIFGPHEIAPSVPSLLFAYPISNFPFSKEKVGKITSFCYPGGMLKSNKNGGMIHDQFVFCMNDNGMLLFGFCTHFTISEPSFLSSLINEEMYCLCTIADCPQITANFKFQTYLVSLITGKSDEVRIPTNVTYNDDNWTLTDDNIKRIKEFVPQLTIDKKYTQCAGINVFFIPETFKKAIDLYMRVSTKTGVSFSLDKSTDIFIIPPEDVMNDIATVAFSYLFSALSIQNVARYLRSLLLEQRIIVVGSQLTTISFVVLSSLVLVAPLQLKCSMLPILPSDPVFLNFLDSPIPYVFGVLGSSHLEEISIDVDHTVLFIDDNSISYPDDIPHMPNASQLRESLSKLIENDEYLVPKGRAAKDFWKFRDLIGIPTYMSIHLQNKYCFFQGQSQSIMAVFNKFIEQFVSKNKLSASTMRNTTDPDNPAVGFVKEAYMIDEPSESLYFLDVFVGTQAFQAYFDKVVFS
jgi:hypothetical protein